MTTVPRRSVGSINFSVLNFDAAINELLNCARSVQEQEHPGIGVHFANAFNVALARKDAKYAQLLNAGDYVFSDGVPITWVGKRAYRKLAASWDRVYGPDVMEAVLAASEQPANASITHYLLGSTPPVLEALQEQLSTRFPKAHIVGADSPPFGVPTEAQLRERDQRITDSGATMVWVGLGTPKQDYEVARLAATLPVVALAVGAAFDFLAGTTPQAPLWMQKNGLEWAYRLASEPRRLSHRYLWGNSVFLLEASRTLRRR